MLGDAALLDLGSLDFMRAKVGLGVFVAQAGTLDWYARYTLGPNRLMLHQAANDGFRGVYVVCFDGPDAKDGPQGFVILSNGDNSAMFLNCDLCITILRELNLQGVDFSNAANKRMTVEEVLQAPQEHIVNLGYKELVFRAFIQPPRPEEPDDLFEGCYSCF